MEIGRHILVFYVQCLDNHTKDPAQRSNWDFITFLGTFFLYQHHAQMHSNFDADGAKFFLLQSVPNIMTCCLLNVDPLLFNCYHKKYFLLSYNSLFADDEIDFAI